MRWEDGRSTPVCEQSDRQYNSQCFTTVREIACPYREQGHLAFLFVSLFYLNLKEKLILALWRGARLTQPQSATWGARGLPGCMRSWQQRQKKIKKKSFDAEIFLPRKTFAWVCFGQCQESLSLCPDKVISFSAVWKCLTGESTARSLNKRWILESRKWRVVRH